MPLRDDDIANDDLSSLAFLVIANATIDLVEHLQQHNAPDCVVKDVMAIADTANAAASGGLTQQHISNFRWYLSERMAVGSA